MVVILALVFLANSALLTQADAWDHAQALLLQEALPLVADLLADKAAVLGHGAPGSCQTAKPGSLLLPELQICLENAAFLYQGSFLKCKEQI